MNSLLLTRHQAEGATLASFSGCTLPESFAPDWKDEWRLAREAVALFDTNWHAISILTGPDRVRYLNAIVSNDVQSLAEGQGTLALLLDARAHILAELEVYVQPDRLLVLSHASVRESTMATLDKYIIMDDVQLDDATDRFGTIAVEGIQAGAIISEATGISFTGLGEFQGARTKIAGMECYIVRRSHFGAPGAEIIAPVEKLEAIWNTLHSVVHAFHGGPLGMMALNALRLEAGIPWFPLDFDDSVIPQEAALEDTHLSFTKGCYTGQEIVERVRSRGHVNRRRVRLSFGTAAEPPAPGTMLRAGDLDVGEVTSAAFSPAAGTPIGMGYLRAEYTSPGTIVDAEGRKATVLGPDPATPKRSIRTGV
ncbi:MAG TPA: aminomethyltransferase family protein [Candidatus Acidoferrum sp.]|nr:aminomethyltransferase family protein [Candidatus Acidoferrum sp.]